MLLKREDSGWFVAWEGSAKNWQMESNACVFKSKWIIIIVSLFVPFFSFYRKLRIIISACQHLYSFEWFDGKKYLFLITLRYFYCNNFEVRKQLCYGGQENYAVVSNRLQGQNIYFINKHSRFEFANLNHKSGCIFLINCKLALEGFFFWLVSTKFWKIKQKKTTHASITANEL